MISVSRISLILAGIAVAATTAMPTVTLAQSPVQKPNIILIVSDDFGYGDSGPYGDMSDDLRAMFNKVTKGSMSGRAGQKPTELQGVWL